MIFSLGQVIRDTAASLYEQQAVLEELSGQYVDDYGAKRTVGEQARGVVARARAKVHDEVDRIFDRVGLDA